MASNSDVVQSDSVVIETIVVETQYLTLGVETPKSTTFDTSTTEVVDVKTSSKITTTSIVEPSSTSSIPSSTASIVELSSTYSIPSSTPSSVAPTSTQVILPSTSVLHTSTQELPQVILSPSSSVIPTSIAHVPELATSTSSSVTATVEAVVTSTASLSVNSDNHKQSVVGGLAGAMGGAVFIAVLILLLCCDRRRRRHIDNEKQIPQLLDDSGYYAPPIYTTPKQGSIRSFRTADGNVIRISVDQFSRPFVEKEGWRESIGPQRLRVMNPDKSLPGTPELPYRGPDYFSRPKTPQIPAQVKYSNRGAPKLPLIQIEETSPEEYITPVMKSSSSLTIIQHPPEDPFNSSTTNPRQSQRQGTWSSLSHALVALRPGISPRQSISDYSARSSRRVSSVTDPFELESPQLKQTRFIKQNNRIQPTGLYEGT